MASILKLNISGHYNVQICLIFCKIPSFLIVHLIVSLANPIILRGMNLIRLCNSQDDGFLTYLYNSYDVTIWIL